MTTRTITTTQLRGMIKEALEESVQEIAVDEQIAALKAKGGRRSLQETKQYRKLLEFKMGGMVDMQALGGPEQREEPFFPSTTEEEAETIGEREEGETIGEREEGEKDEEKELATSLKDALDIMSNPKTMVGRKLHLSLRKPIADRAKFVARVAQLVGIDTSAEKSTVAKDIRGIEGGMVNESRRRFLRRR